MNLPTTVDYPVLAVGDLHGRAAWLRDLLLRLDRLPEWPAARLVFLGDFCDRCDAVRDAIEIVLGLVRDKPGTTAVMGNHDLALVRAAGLDDRPPSAYWRQRYGDAYDHAFTFRSYLGRPPTATRGQAWEDELAELKAAMPETHRRFLAGLPWGVEAAGHLFLHAGLSRELDRSAAAQYECVRQKRWSRATAEPKFGTPLDRWFHDEYPAWLGADRRASRNPLPFPGKVQVVGHEYTKRPDADAVRIRLDTTGGSTEPLTACLLRTPTAAPIFIASTDPISDR